MKTQQAMNTFCIRFILLFSLLTSVKSVVAQDTLTTEKNLIRTGDRLYKSAVSGIGAGASGNNVSWNYANARVSDTEHMSYDSKGRPTKTVSTTLAGGTETSATSYTYTGNPANVTYSVNGLTGGTFTGTLTNQYNSKNDKLQSVRLNVTEGGTAAARTVAAYTYDGLGRISTVTRSGSAGTAEYGYNVRGWLTSISAKSFGAELHYTDGDGVPCYNGNISSMLWTNSNYGATRGYKYSYDGQNRLVAAVYGEGPGLTDKANRYNEEVLAYTRNGAIERLQRRGRKQNQIYGKIDNLNIELDGNRVIRVEDDALPISYAGALDFTDDPGKGVEYTYNGDGALTGDKNRGISLIEYDLCGYPRRIQYADGSVTEYVYTVTGRKLRAIHRTAVPNISVPFGQAKVLTPSETLSTDSVDYLGNLIVRDKRPEMYLFDGGYCTFGTNGAAVFHYYDRDHQGNIRGVINENGTVEQVLNYYPFGAPYCDGTTLNADLQPYKYNGKELETMHGRNAYDYGARFYDPLLPTWDRMDPLCEKYYHISPYAYCKNNPVNRIDLNGEDDYYTIFGDFIFRDDKQTDNIIIRDKILHDTKMMTGIKWMSTADIPLYKITLSAKAYSKIFTHILSEMNGIDVGLLHNGKVSVIVWDEISGNLKTSINYYNDPSSDGSSVASMNHGGNIMTAYIYPKDSKERQIYSTVSNVQNMLGEHEYWGHFKNGWSEFSGTHHKVYEYQMKQPSWEKTTDLYKNLIEYLYNKDKKK